MSSICQRAQCGRWFTLKHSKADLQSPDLKSSSKMCLDCMTPAFIIEKLKAYCPNMYSTYVLWLWSFPRTTYERPMKPFFIKIPNFWAWADNLGRWILGHLGYFRPIYQHPFWYCPLSMFSIDQPLYPNLNPKYSFGIGIWICATKNLGFSHRVSVVCDPSHYFVHRVLKNNREEGCAWIDSILSINTIF